MSNAKDAGVATTNKPHGGWHPRTRPFDPKQAAADMQIGNFDGVIKLLNLDIHPDAILTEQGNGALMACIAHEATSVAERLLEAGAHPDKNPARDQDATYIGCVLHRLRPGPHQPMLRLLLAHGASTNLPIHTHGLPPLCFAAKHALTGPAQLLAAAGADAFLRDEDGLCAIDHALALPDFQKSLMLWSIFPPPIEASTLDRLFDMFPPGHEAMAEWLAQSWINAANP